MKKLFKFGWIILIIGLVALGIGYFNHGDKTIYFENGRPVIAHDHVKKLVNNQKFNQIDLSASTASVVVREGKKYQVTYYGLDSHAPSANISNGRLKVKQTGYMNLNDYRNQDLIIITVPHGESLTGKIHLDSGDLTITKVLLDNVDVSNDDGNVNYQQVTVNGGKTSLESDDFTAQDLTVHGHYTVSNQDGDNTVTNTTVDGYYLETQDGDNELNGQDKGSETLSQNDTAENVLRLITQDGDNEVN